MYDKTSIRTRLFFLTAMAAAIVLATFPGGVAGSASEDTGVGLADWSEFADGQVVGQGVAAAQPDGSTACHFERAEGTITFLPEEAQAIHEAGVAVTRTLRLGTTSTCELVVVSSAQTVEPLPDSVPTPPVSIPGQVEVGAETDGGVGTEAVCPKLEGIVTYRPFYGGPDYLTETRVKIDYCYTGSSVSISLAEYWCKANGGHAFILDSCTRPSVKWSGWDAWYTRRGDYHQFCCQFDHFSSMNDYVRGDGLAQCQWSVGGSTPRDNPEITCRYV